MNRAFGILVVVVLFVALMPRPASAHTFKFEQGVAAMMHVNPEDDPRASEKASLVFLVSYADYSAYTCTCQVSVVDQGKTIFTSGTLDSNPTVPYVFPHAGVYQLVLSGTDNKASTFSVSFDQRVEAGSITKRIIDSGIVVYAIAGAVAALAGIAGMMISIKKK